MIESSLQSDGLNGLQNAGESSVAMNSMQHCQVMNLISIAEDSAAWKGKSIGFTQGLRIVRYEIRQTGFPEANIKFEKQNSICYIM